MEEGDDASTAYMLLVTRGADGLTIELAPPRRGMEPEGPSLDRQHQELLGLLRAIWTQSS